MGPDQPANDVNLDLYESNTHPFIVKIWLEATAEEAGRAQWRGHITHVPSGERCYLQELENITDFIAPYLMQMGVRFGPGWRVKRWLMRRKLNLTNES